MRQRRLAIAGLRSGSNDWRPWIGSEPLRAVNRNLVTSANRDGICLSALTGGTLPRPRMEQGEDEG